MAVTYPTAIALDASWSFFVKTNEKYACDGIVGTVKHRAVGWNLQKNSNVISQKFVWFLSNW